MFDPRVNVPCELPEELPQSEWTPERWRQNAEWFRDHAARFRKLIEKEERDSGGHSPTWPNTKAALLEMAELCDRNAEYAEARSRS